MKNEIRRLIKEEIARVKRCKELTEMVWERWGGKEDGVPLFTLCTYVPMSTQKEVGDREEVFREIVLDIKDGFEDDEDYMQSYRAVLLTLAKQILETWGDTAQELTVIPIPASSRERTSQRWKNLLEDLTTITSMENGYGALMPTEDRIPRHWRHGRIPPKPFKVDKSLVEGRMVILLDDLVNSGKTMSQAAEQVEENGGHIVACFTIGRTPES